MGRDRGSRDPTDQNVDPQSARQEIAEGAREIAVDDWVDAQLRERPKTVSGMKAVGTFRETARGMGSPAMGSSVAGPPGSGSQVSGSQGSGSQGSGGSPAPPHDAPDTQREPPKWSASTVAFVALKDERISQLEEQLAKAKADLMSREAAPMPAPRPAPAQRTIPMQALAAPPPPTYAAPPVGPRGQGATLFMPAPDAHVGPRGQGATLFMPATDAAGASPSPMPMAATPMAPTAAGRPAPDPARAPVQAAEPAARPIADPLSEDDGGARTMMLAPDAAMPFGATAPSDLEPFAPAPSVQSVPPLGPAPPVASMPPGPLPSYLSPHHEPTAKTFEAGDLVLAPPRRRKGGWLIGVALLAIALVGAAYAYRAGLGPFAALRASEMSKGEAATTKTQATQADAKTTAATTTATSASNATTAATTTSPSATPSATATEAPPPSAEAPPPVAPDDPNDLAALLSFQGYLTVTSSGDAEVVVQGQPAGRTNTRLLVRCGPRNVRLQSDDAKWLSEGQHVQIDCMQHTHVTIAIQP